MENSILNMNLVRILVTSLTDSECWKSNSCSGSMSWKVVHRSFCTEHFIKTSSIIETQREFRTHFIIHRKWSVPYHELISKWLANFRSMVPVTKPRSGGPSLSARTPDKINRVSEALRGNPKLSTQKHALSLYMSVRSMWRIFTFI